MTPEIFIMAYGHIPAIYLDGAFLFRINPYDYGKLKVDEHFFNNDFNKLLEELSDYIIKYQKENIPTLT